MDFVASLRTMKIQSATTIAIESMKYMKSFSAKNGFGRKFDVECKRLVNARPTAVVLYNAIERVRRNKSAGGINAVMKELETSKDMAARNSSFIFKNSTILTHCHSSFVVAALSKNRSRVKSVIVTETRPRDQGVITAKELLAKKIRVSFIIDSAIGNFVSGVSAVVVGADALRREGLVNKVGTHPMALAAKENKKPFYVITSSFAADTRRKIIMEERPVSELKHNNLKRAKIYNPAFDITPWKYVTSIITEKGVMKPRKFKRRYL